MDIELTKTIARVRRAMPRNADVMSLCDALEARLATVEKVEPERTIGGVPVSAARVIAKAIRNRTDKPKFDRNAYQRELMRKRRAKENGTP